MWHLIDHIKLLLIVSFNKSSGQSVRMGSDELIQSLPYVPLYIVIILMFMFPPLPSALFRILLWRQGNLLDSYHVGARHPTISSSISGDAVIRVAVMHPDVRGTPSDITRYRSCYNLYIV